MTRYHPFLVALHWLVAIMAAIALFMGTFVLTEIPNSDPQKLFGLFGHMTVGVLILVLMLVRLIVRFRSAKPPRADIGSPILNTLGTVMHWALYLAVIAMAASGLALANMAGLPDIVFFGSGNPLPADFSQYGPRAVHGVIAKVLMLLIAGHIAAFLYHQFVRKDGLFSRMWFGNRTK